MEKQYQKPNMEIVLFTGEDVIRTSIGEDQPGDNIQDFDSLFN